ncbi:alpha/beta fold hydrolase [Mycolicibacterium tusciae]|uniref:alpha/beta fold hydrolase n=1 Tax=Mycolicibacterium tusciae TaxID=75922 RepID=UPI00024A2E83|nr:alpha/beta hydrolase [Mycolicibacterium tusciae]
MAVESRGYRIDYTVDGDGPPLLLIAGTLCAARHWRDFGYCEALVRDWRVINVDPLGHGASDVPHDADAYVAAGVTADLVAVLDAEGIDRVTAWGYSRGGWLACNLASRHPERVDHIVVGAYAMGAHDEEVGRLLRPLAHFLRRGDWSALWQALGVTDPGLREMFEAGNDPLAVAAAIEGSLRPTRYIDPATIGCRATCYVGSEDWIVPHVRADAEALDATVDLIEGQAHIGSFFAAAEPVLEVVAARLQR